MCVSFVIVDKSEGREDGNVHAKGAEEDQYAQVEEVRYSYREAEEYTDNSGPVIHHVSIIVQRLPIVQSITHCFVLHRYRHVSILSKFEYSIRGTTRPIQLHELS